MEAVGRLVRLSPSRYQQEQASVKTRRMNAAGVLGFRV